MSDLNVVQTPGYTFASTAVPAGHNTSCLYPYHDRQVADDLIVTARSLVSPRAKGIYATDETPEGIGARLAAAAGGGSIVYSRQENHDRRRRWRECMYESLPTGTCLSSYRAELH